MHLFTVRTIAINSIENVESKCACTLVTGTHKCFNIFTPTSHWVATIPSKYTTVGRVVGSGGRVGWLDKLGIRLNSAPTGVDFGWSWD